MKKIDGGGYVPSEETKHDCPLPAKKPIVVLLTIIALAAIWFALGVVVSRSINKPKQSYEYTIYRSQCELEYYAAKEELVSTVDSFIRSQAPSSSLNAIALVDACDEYNVDLQFVLAQGLKESHFGTTGVAAKTNSVFNVMAYDGRSAKDMIKKGHGYSHPDESIEPYLKLITTQYLVDGKTEQDLLHKYTNSYGGRYATDSNYEASLSKIYERISNTTNIPRVYSMYKRYKILVDK